MLKGIQWFIERIVERIVPIIASSFSSTVEMFHALGQAEQQSRIEEAALKYEADGKPEIAAVLRQRAAQLTSDNPASQALPMIQNLAQDAERFQRLGEEPQQSSQPSRLPDFSQSENKRGRRKKSTAKSRPASSAQESPGADDPR